MLPTPPQYFRPSPWLVQSSAVSQPAMGVGGASPPSNQLRIQPWPLRSQVPIRPLVWHGPSTHRHSMTASSCNTARWGNPGRPEQRGQAGQALPPRQHTGRLVRLSARRLAQELGTQRGLGANLGEGTITHQGHCPTQAMIHGHSHIQPWHCTLLKPGAWQGQIEARPLKHL
ncbi:hypothetical protein KIL84_003246 [Mauremys mutica]|uniref:Uncharacterized protein n=1 Tax=Mauremys mutica TaxID=74926 RepID=A0A9D3WW44_9SAUR|nr:hypothetical protein KIL84_003246 [Mauremys mutica]